MATRLAVSKISCTAFCATLAFLISGCDPGKEGEADRPSPRPDPAVPPTKTESVSEDVDLIGDKPGAPAPAKADKLTVLLDPIEPTGPINRTARQCYKLIADMKFNVEKINVDLDDGGKQVTRLIHTSDELCKNITDLAGVWTANEEFRDQCVSAKRQALTLNDELSRVPRTWAHVRWAFTSTLKAISKLRNSARELAEAEPKPQVVVGKDGKVTLVEAEPVVDPLIARRNEEVAKVNKARAQKRKLEEEAKKKELQIDLDGK